MLDFSHAIESAINWLSYWLYWCISMYWAGWPYGKDPREEMAASQEIMPAAYGLRDTQ